ncbi:MAG: tetratricopeptide repeat protein [Bdellovibrionaceae bacterium]|nr:tetratricopeptide repeat protein [Pseudobdellovibrionaceae bacterium]
MFRYMPFLLLFFISGCLDSSNPKAWWLNRRSIEHLEKENRDLFRDDILDAMVHEPFRPELHLNLGLAYEMSGEAEKALRSWAGVENLTSDKEAHFYAYFNQAQLLGKAKQYDQALELYKKALEIRPSSTEVKTNIELLLQDQQKQQQSGQQNQQSGGSQSQNQDQRQNQNQQQNEKKPNNEQNKDDDREKSKSLQYEPYKKYVPREFKGELDEAAVRKIFTELRQQDQRIRSRYQKKEIKESPREKDW